MTLHDLIGDEWKEAWFPNYAHEIAQQVKAKKNFVCLRCKRVAKLKSMASIPCKMHWETFSSGFIPEP